MGLFSKKEACARCHRESKLSASGYCNECEKLKAIIFNIQASYFANNHEATNQEYAYINKEFSYSRDRIRVKEVREPDVLTEIEKAFMSYIESKPAEGFSITGVWIYQHFIDANYIVSKLLKYGYIEFAKVAHLESMKVAELKEMLKEYGLKATGLKPDLMKEAQNLSQDQIEKFGGVKERILLTEKGKMICPVKGILSKDAKMENNCISLILQNKLKEAYGLVCNYESAKLIGRGIGSDWSNAKYESKFSMTSKLPFELPETLVPYENEMRACAIYSNMMGNNSIAAKRVFLSRNEISIDENLIERSLQAMQMLCAGITIPNDFKLTKTSQETSSWVYTDDSKDKFANKLKEKIKESGLNPELITFTEKKDGTLDFNYKNMSLGRIKLGKRTSSMQLQTITEKKVDYGYGSVFFEPEYFVDWISNKSLETYMNSIQKWIDAYLKAEEINKKNKDDIDRLFEN